MRSLFLVERSVTRFLPLWMSYVAKQCVVMSWQVRELAHRHQAMTAAQKLEELRHRQRGFSGFCLNQNIDDKHNINVQGPNGIEKNIKNTAVIAELCELLCCPSSHAPESKLSRRLEAHHSFVGETQPLQRQKH